MQIRATFFQFISKLFQRIDLKMLEIKQVRDNNLNTCIGLFKVQIDRYELTMWRETSNPNYRAKRPMLRLLFILTCKKHTNKDVLRGSNIHNKSKRSTLPY